MFGSGPLKYWVEDSSRSSRVAMDDKARVTAIVAGLSDPTGQPGVAAEELLPLVYDQLRRLAGYLMQSERPAHTLQPTALVHEAYLKLVDQSRVNWRGRTQFFAVGALAMRRLLVDHARQRATAKRRIPGLRVTLAEYLSPAPEGGLEPEELLSLSSALDRLTQLDERQARIVELRFFGGLTVHEVAQVLEVSERTVATDWAHARAWLERELSSKHSTEGAR